MKFRLREYFKSYRLSVLRWMVVGSIVGSIFLADYFLRREISAQVADAWAEACIKELSISVCNARVESHHGDCFEPSYSSMLMRFGKSRLEALDITSYETCMSDLFKPTKPSDTRPKFSVSGEIER